MSLKSKKLDQGATEIFISELEKEESLWDVMSEIYKNRDVKKASFKRFPEVFEIVVIDSSFSYYLLVSLLV